MLILHRKPDEALLIGSDIRVVVLGSDAHGARIGIEAPSAVTILREEIKREVEEENVRASHAARKVNALEVLSKLQRDEKEGDGA